MSNETTPPADSNIENPESKGGVATFIEKHKKESKEVDKLWDEIGFHRPLAGFWYKLALGLFSSIIGIVLLSVWYRWFYPYPESAGYKSAATSIFSLFFFTFDLGTNMCQERFIAEARIKNPGKMIQYIQYFIWYQMITGLLQTTTVSIYALYFVPRTELAYAVWIMLIQSTTQYPGWLGIFRGTLSSMQQFNKAELLNFVSGEVFQRITEILFVIWGRYVLGADPRIGEILGIAIGSIIGLYVDDFFATWLAAHYFDKVMKAEGITTKRCFKREFDMNLVKEVLFFGIKTGMPTFIGLVADFIMLWQWILYVPQYTTFVTLAGMAGGISGIINNAMGISLTAAISEAYLNDKKDLTNYYIGQYARFAGIVQMFLVCIVFIVLSVLEPVYLAFGLDNYIMAIPFIIPQLIRNLQQPYTSLADTILLGTNHPTFLMYIRFAEEILKVIFITLFLVVLQLPLRYGFTAVIWIYPCGIYPAILFKTISIYIYVNKKVMKLAIPFWQAHVAPIGATILVYLIALALKASVFEPIWATYGILPAVIAVLACIALVLIFVFFPVTGVLGAWDKASLHDFKKAARMSGPSKWLVMPMYKMCEFGARLCPFGERFAIDSSKAVIEAAELLEIKRVHKARNDAEKIALD